MVRFWAAVIKMWDANTPLGRLSPPLLPTSVQFWAVTVWPLTLLVDPLDYALMH